MSGPTEIPKWLKSFPLAPEYHPTETEFADPIAFISRIEREASAFGICKIVPPLPKPSKRFVLSNLAGSLAAPDSSPSPSPSPATVFTTRHQELGARKSAVHRHKQQVWQSGEFYTLDEFESKSKSFQKSYLGHFKEVTPLLIESLFWKAASEMPIYVEYANDVPGSGFTLPEEPFLYRKKRRKFGEQTRSSVEEGTAGWKLSNSPWNLQVIARAPGSLTKFMPDEVPGVTSPMVYIGMLFSWFAWHVEDHELHSLNFLHMGAPKTWYAVPGEYANTMEEVVRLEGYGGDLDRLEAFTMLGEKTTLLSPEVIVNAGIPCCRLVQNPGEFVVTFPRAYHVGFSHGFNCGEAANFATPQWLKVAKEAAVRRAAMNHLPMLSHQQLLYLLTVSFISRVPRALLSGVRSSRLSDRKKEEREILVKKAFLNDLTSEINLLCTLLQKESTSYAVLWAPDLLNPCTISHSFSSSSSQGVQGSAVNADDGRGICQLKHEISHLFNDKEDPSWESTHNPASIPCQAPSIEKDKNAPDTGSISSVELLEILDAEEDDLPFGLNIDSGTLQCVACGILGYPFMAILQPSEAATKELFSCTEEPQNNLGKSGCSYMSSLLPSTAHKFGPGLGGSMNIKINPDAGFVLSNAIVPVTKPLPEIHSLHGVADENTKLASSNGFNRSRIFCLQHALEVEELLQHKGGAHVMVLCHSDYLKIKSYTPSIAEEVGMEFHITNIPLENASPSDLNLINISIDDGELEQHGEDWTSKLGVNLRYCMKLRKQSTSKQERLTLALGRIFSDPFTLSDFSTLKWHSRRSRTPYKVVGVSIAKSLVGTNLEKCNVVEKANFATKFKDYHSYRKKPNEMASKHHGCIVKDVQLDSRSGSIIVNVKDDYSAASYRHYPGEKAEDNQTKSLFTVPISAAEDLQMHQGSWFPLKVGRADILTDSESYETYRPCALVPVFESSESLEICQGTNSPVEFLLEYKDDNSKNPESQSNLLQLEPINSEVHQEVETFDETNLEHEVCNNIESGREPTSQGAVNNARDLQDIPVPQEPSSLGNLGNFVLFANQSHVSVLPSTEVEVSSSAECQVEVNVFHSLESEEQLLSDLPTLDSLGIQEEEIAKAEMSVEAVPKMDARVNHSFRLVEPIVRTLSTIGRCRMQHEEIRRLDVTIAEEPNMEGTVDPYLRSEMQLVNNLSITESCGMQRDLCTAEEPREDRNDGHSPSGGLLASNLSTADTRGMLQEEILASENDLQNGVSSVLLERHLTDAPTVVSSEVQQETCANETKINNKVDCLKPVVDSTLVNSAHVAVFEVKGSGVQESVKNIEQFGESYKNLNNTCIIWYVRRRTKRKQQEEQMAEKEKREEQIEERRKHYVRRRTKRKQEQLEEKRKREEEPMADKRKQEEGQITEKRKREEEEMTESHHKWNGRLYTDREENHIPEGNQSHNNSFIRSPCEGLRSRTLPVMAAPGKVGSQTLEHNRAKSKVKRSGKGNLEEFYECDIEGCRLMFRRKRDLQLHTQNRCTYTNCGKRFRSHNVLKRHQRVHDVERPLKCPWEGCQMSFKWEWARTEHLRIHTGERPYQCTVAGCGLTFRYVSAFSKHRRKTGHYVLRKLN